VAGAGFAGVETLASINDFLRNSLRFYPNLAESDLRLTLIHPGEVILPELSAKLGKYAQRKLEERGIEVMAHSRVTSYDGSTIELADGKAARSENIDLDSRNECRRACCAVGGQNLPVVRSGSSAQFPIARSDKYIVKTLIQAMGHLEQIIGPEQRNYIARTPSKIAEQWRHCARWASSRT
jgi:NADH dehydrogenase FAD-containing subunit